MVTAAPPVKNSPKAGRSRLAIFASVKMTVTLLVLIATTVLVGAWCPQESQVGQDKVVEQFGEEMAFTLIRLGIADIFHTPWFLGLIGLLTVNMVACSVQRVFPKVRSLRQPLPWLKGQEIVKLPYKKEVALNTGAETVLNSLQKRLERSGYKVKRNGCGLVAESGKIGRLAPTVTHIGLLSLLAGVTITSWTGFSGFQPVPLEGSLSFSSSEHSKLWIGSLPEWRVRVDKTWREDYPNGEAKQWYTDLTVIDSKGRETKKQRISVNNPLSWEGVDIYQSSWGLDRLEIGFNKSRRGFELRPMGKLYAAFLELEPGTVLIFSVKDQESPLRLFGKVENWESPRLLAEIPVGQGVRLGSVDLRYIRVIPVSGLQYKCDPGLPVTYIAFGFIICGVLLATIPHRQLWAYAGLDEALATDREQNACILFLGGRALKAKTAFEKGLNKLAGQLQSEFGLREVSDVRATACLN